MCVCGAARHRRKQDVRGSTVISVCLCFTQSHNVHSSSRLDRTSANNLTALAWVMQFRRAQRVGVRAFFNDTKTHLEGGKGSERRKKSKRIFLL